MVVRKKKRRRKKVVKRDISRLGVGKVNEIWSESGIIVNITGSE